MLDKIKENYRILLLLFLVLLGVGSITLKVILDKHTFINESTREIFSDQEDNTTYYTDLNGNSVSLEKYLGKILVVNSWASWSPFSTTELILLQEVAQNYNQDEVIFLAINRKESREQAQRFVSTLPELSSLLMVIDIEDHFYTSIGGYAMPETVIYNKNGDLTEHIHGIIKKEEITSKLDELLGT